MPQKLANLIEKKHIGVVLPLGISICNCQEWFDFPNQILAPPVSCDLLRTAVCHRPDKGFEFTAQVCIAFFLQYLSVEAMDPGDS